MTKEEKMTLRRRVNMKQQTALTVCVKGQTLGERRQSAESMLAIRS